MGRREPRAGRRTEGGFVLVLVTIGMLLIAGFAALAVDGARLASMRSQCQVTADGAALAAVNELPDLAAVRARAIEYAGKNMPPGLHGATLDPADVETGHWDPDDRSFTPGGVPSDAVRLTIRRTADSGNAVPLTLGRVFGLDSSDVLATAVASFGTAQKWDVTLLQDVTTSFAQEIEDAKDGDQVLLDCILDHAHIDSRFGLVTFTGWGQVVSPLLEIGSGHAALSSSIGSISNCGSSGMPPCSGTDVAAGLETAVNLMVGDPPDDPETAQAIILVGDGQPSSSWSGSHPGKSVHQLKQYARNWADNADAAGISVFVVFFDENNDAAASDFMASLVRGEGIYLRTPDPAQIPDLLMTICAQLPRKLVD